MSGPASARATDPKYTIRVAVRGDEMYLPFAIRAGVDYAPGEDLEEVAKRIARDIVHGKYSLGEDATVSVFTIPDPELVACLEDYEPVPLVWATAYAR